MSPSASCTRKQSQLSFSLEAYCSLQACCENLQAHFSPSTPCDALGIGNNHLPEHSTYKSHRTLGKCTDRKGFVLFAVSATLYQANYATLTFFFLLQSQILAQESSGFLG